MVLATQDLGETAIKDPLTTLLTLPFQIGQQVLEQMVPTSPAAKPLPLAEAEEAVQWGETAAKLQQLWIDFNLEQANKALSGNQFLTEMQQRAAMTPAMIEMIEGWTKQIPLVRPDNQEKLLADGAALWESVLAQWGLHVTSPEKAKEVPLPRSDRRFSDPAWRENPYFALVHQTYLLFAEQATAMADRVEGLDPAHKEQLRFMTRTMVEALSPDHFPLTNPLVMEKAMETRGESLVKGMEHLLTDMKQGQLSHAAPGAFTVGENIAVTPGKVIHRAPLFEIIQYSPTTDQVDAVPLLIFPPWINRFYILDLNPKKSFVQWAVAQGLTVFMVSWKSADPQDETLDWSKVVWDDYISAQVEAIEVVRERLKVPAVHTIGYCVAGTTLAATLAILARRGEADKVASATFFTAQVDFEKAGELKNFIDDQQLAAMATLANNGVMDGRYLAATFNLLRGNDLIWNYVTNNYLLGADYPAFDLLFWNGDTTNLPATWHGAYLRDLYRDNLLVVPDRLSACGTPIDLKQIVTPCYIQAGREDHIAPPESVFRLTKQLPKAPHQFILAGSGHIAGVVNPPAAKKYQYWTCEGDTDTLESFVEQAKETPGSWWPHWLGWLRSISAEQVAAKGKRAPGGRGDKVLDNAPGLYVRLR
jgi:polyhydroxyalkanoate synthase